MTQFIKYFSVIVILIVVASLFLPKQFIGRAASITEIHDKSTESRLKQYQMSTEIMMDRPLLGTGIGQVSAYSAQYGAPGIGDIHNVIMQIGAERGIHEGHRQVHVEVVALPLEALMGSHRHAKVQVCPPAA